MYALAYSSDYFSGELGYDYFLYMYLRFFEVF